MRYEMKPWECATNRNTHNVAPITKSQMISVICDKTKALYKDLKWLQNSKKFDNYTSEQRGKLNKLINMMDKAAEQLLIIQHDLQKSKEQPKALHRKNQLKRR